jgi:Arc/MetJ-type ribon-helix-helix transcriptional regulator
MKKQNEKIGIRISQEQKKAATQLVESGKFKNISQVIRTALKELLLAQRGSFEDES